VTWANKYFPLFIAQSMPDWQTWQIEGFSSNRLNYKNN